MESTGIRKNLKVVAHVVGVLMCVWLMLLALGVIVADINVSLGRDCSSCQKLLDMTPEMRDVLMVFALIGGAYIVNDLVDELGTTLSTRAKGFIMFFMWGALIVVGGYVLVGVVIKSYNDITTEVRETPWRKGPNTIQTGDPKGNGSVVPNGTSGGGPAPNGTNGN